MIHFSIESHEPPKLAVAVFVHGFMGSGEDFEEVSGELKAHRRCVRVDLPGHGKSVGALCGERADVAFMAAEVLGMMDHLGVEQVDLVGYSMGGRVALYLAKEHPERVRTLVLESASPGLVGKNERAERARLDAERGRQMREQGLGAFLRAWYELELFESLRDHPRFEAMVAERARGDVGALSRVIEEASPGLQEDLWPALATLKPPSLWLAGALDGRYAAMAQKAAALSGGEARIIEGAGHNAHLEAPREVAGAIAAFWKGQSGG